MESWGQDRKTKSVWQLKKHAVCGELIVDTALGIQGSGVVELFVFVDTEEAEEAFAFEKARLLPLLARLRVAVRSTIPYEMVRRVFGSLTTHSGY